MQRLEIVATDGLRVSKKKQDLQILSFPMLYELSIRLDTTGMLSSLRALYRLGSLRTLRTFYLHITIPRGYPTVGHGEQLAKRLYNMLISCQKLSSLRVICPRKCVGLEHVDILLLLDFPQLKTLYYMKPIQDIVLEDVKTIGYISNLGLINPDKQTLLRLPENVKELHLMTNIDCLFTRELMVFGIEVLINRLEYVEHLYLQTTLLWVLDDNLKNSPNLKSVTVEPDRLGSAIIPADLKEVLACLLANWRYRFEELHVLTFSGFYITPIHVLREQLADIQGWRVEMQERQLSYINTTQQGPTVIDLHFFKIY